VQSNSGLVLLHQTQRRSPFGSDARFLEWRTIGCGRPWPLSARCASSDGAAADRPHPLSCGRSGRKYSSNPEMLGRSEHLRPCPRPHRRCRRPLPRRDRQRRPPWQLRLRFQWSSVSRLKWLHTHTELKRACTSAAPLPDAGSDLSASGQQPCEAILWTTWRCRHGFRADWRPTVGLHGRITHGSLRLARLLASDPTIARSVAMSEWRQISREASRGRSREPWSLGRPTKFSPASRRIHW
jgi:hypothetical protein